MNLKSLNHNDIIGEPYITSLSEEEIIKHIKKLKASNIPEVEKQGMISNWERCLNQNKDE